MKALLAIAAFVLIAAFAASPADAGPCQDGCLKIYRTCKRMNENNCGATQHRCWNACRRSHPEEFRRGE